MQLKPEKLFSLAARAFAETVRPKPKLDTLMTLAARAFALALTASYEEDSRPYDFISRHVADDNLKNAVITERVYCDMNAREAQYKLQSPHMVSGSDWRMSKRPVCVFGLRPRRTDGAGWSIVDPVHEHMCYKLRAIRRYVTRFH